MIYSKNLLAIIVILSILLLTLKSNHHIETMSYSNLILEDN